MGVGKMGDQKTLVAVLNLLLVLATLSSSGGDGVGSIISQSFFDEILKHRNDGACPGRNFYTYDAFIAAANSFSGFGTTGDSDTRKREIAAFLAQTSYETAGGWGAAPPDGPDSWGYCYIQEQGNPGDNCDPSAKWPCAQDKKYYGRGPIQIAYNYNYGQAGQTIGADLLNNPDLVATDATISFKTAIWFWMTWWPPRPSCHSVMVGQWSPSKDDTDAWRLPGYGVVTNILNGRIECGNGSDSRATRRIGFYQRYCELLGVPYGSNLACDIQRPFG